MPVHAVYVCLYACMQAVCMSVCIPYVCIHVCMHACMHACMCVCVCEYTYISRISRESSCTFRLSATSPPSACLYVCIYIHTYVSYVVPAPGRSQACDLLLPSYLWQSHVFPSFTAYVSIRQRTSAYVSVRQRTSAYVSVITLAITRIPLFKASCIISLRLHILVAEGLIH